MFPACDYLISWLHVVVLIVDKRGLSTCAGTEQMSNGEICAIFPGAHSHILQLMHQTFASMPALWASGKRLRQVRTNLLQNKPFMLVSSSPPFPQVYESEVYPLRSAKGKIESAKVIGKLPSREREPMDCKWWQWNMIKHIIYIVYDCMCIYIYT